eukprot:1149349-Pelagomonas_calceolata.AAC.7
MTGKPNSRDRVAARPPKDTALTFPNTYHESASNDHYNEGDDAGQGNPASYCHSAAIACVGVHQHGLQACSALHAGDLQESRQKRAGLVSIHQELPRCLHGVPTAEQQPGLSALKKLLSRSVLALHQGLGQAAAHHADGEHASRPAACFLQGQDEYQGRRAVLDVMVRFETWLTHSAGEQENRRGRQQAEQPNRLPHICNALQHYRLKL